MRTLILLAIAIGFSGCASAHWYKSGANQDDFANTNDYCQLYARATNDNHTWTRSWTMASHAKQCMEEHGWTKVKDSDSRDPASQ